MAYRIVLHKRAEKIYKKLDETTIARINDGIEILRVNPFYGRDIKRLREEGELEGKYRLRIGKYRIVYRVEEDKEIVVIEDIGSREKIY